MSPSQSQSPSPSVPAVRWTPSLAEQLAAIWKWLARRPFTLGEQVREQRAIDRLVREMGDDIHSQSD
jgi:hypothetical protein